MKKLRWGILSTAKIGTEKVVPAMQAGQFCEVAAMASRNLETAQAAAKKLGISKAYGSYEELLADKEIDAVYIPLPNHLHVPWSIRCLQAGKHVLCEKPIGMNGQEAADLLAEAKRHPHLKMMEAFMFRLHPQWQLARRLVSEGQIGQLRTIQAFFSYHNVNADNIRNIAAVGGGGLMDIGCYCISLSRFIFAAEPQRVLGIVEYDAKFKTDRLASAILEFPGGTATFTCSTQLSPYQRVNIFGTEGRVEIEIPFNAPPDRPSKLWHQRGTEIQEHPLKVCNQYMILGDSFSQAVLENKEVPTPLADAVANMRVIEAVAGSGKSNAWVAL
ncbi:MAG TPA: Gfo/Idh/MocA family oxidoreductase [Pirellulales bacterium]|jgi:predicted dehydrogenase|nr:Gfo/Idh/MocA family oxidoreductase [Pirellulales bacterium]